MAKRTSQPAISVLLPVLDGVVALRYGKVIWTAWSGIIWARLLMCFLAAVWLTSLADGWARAARQSDRDRLWGFVPETAAISAEEQGGADV